MSLRRTLSNRLFKSLGLKTRFSKKMSPQIELFETPDSSESEYFQIHNQSIRTKYYEHTPSRGYQQSSKSESIGSHNASITTQYYEPRVSHESKHQPIVSYRPRRTFEEDSLIEDETGNPHSRKKRVAEEYVARLCTKMEQESALIPRENVQHNDNSRLSSENEEDREEDLDDFVDKYRASHPHNEAKKDEAKDVQSLFDKYYTSDPHPHNSLSQDSERELPFLVETRIARQSFSTPTTYSTSSSTRIRTSAFEPVPHELHEERLAHWMEFYSTEPLMRCLDTVEERQYDADLLFKSLLSEVKELIPAVQRDVGYRGVVQRREFWEDVRARLSFEDELVLEWPSGYQSIGDGEPRHRPENEDALDKYLGVRWGSMFGPPASPSSS